MTKTRAFVYHRLYGSVAEQVKHTTFNISHLLQKEFKSCEKQIVSEVCGQMFSAL